jgi:hypothetical protein
MSTAPIAAANAMHFMVFPPTETFKLFRLLFDLVSIRPQDVAVKAAWVQLRPGAAVTAANAEAIATSWRRRARRSAVHPIPIAP